MAEDCFDLLNLLSFYLWSAKITGTNPQVSVCGIEDQTQVFVCDRQHSTNWDTPLPTHMCVDP